MFFNIILTYHLVTLGLFWSYTHTHIFYLNQNMLRTAAYKYLVLEGRIIFGFSLFHLLCKSAM